MRQGWLRATHNGLEEWAKSPLDIEGGRGHRMCSVLLLGTSIAAAAQTRAWGRTVNIRGSYLWNYQVLLFHYPSQVMIYTDNCVCQIWSRYHKVSMQVTWFDLGEIIKHFSKVWLPYSSNKLVALDALNRHGWGVWAVPNSLLWSLKINFNKQKQMTVSNLRKGMSNWALA